MDSALLNYYDSVGRPLCPVCGRAIQSGGPVARVDDCMTHIECYVTALHMDTPCEPSNAATAH